MRLGLHRKPPRRSGSLVVLAGVARDAAADSEAVALVSNSAAALSADRCYQ